MPAFRAQGIVKEQSTFQYWNRFKQPPVQAGEYDVAEQIPGSELPGDNLHPEEEATDNGPADNGPTDNGDIDNGPADNGVAAEPDVNMDELSEEVGSCPVVLSWFFVRSFY